MKRYLFAAIAILALVSCSKEEAGQDPSKQDPSKKEELTEKTAFVKGQEVILTCGQAKTKVTGESDGAGGFKFKWEAGDKILVSMTGHPEQAGLFELISGAGEATATFRGWMPGDGDTFDVQWPANTPNLSTQTQAYVVGGIDASKLLATKANCTLNSTIELEPQYAVLRVHVWDNDLKVGKIEVTNTTASPNETYTLSCGTSGVAIGKTSSTASPFDIIVPTGNWAFILKVYDNAATPVVFHYCETKILQALKMGKVLDMPLAPVYPEEENRMPSLVNGTWWASVNCGYDSSHPYGLLFQWGRLYGQAPEMGDITPSALTKNNGEKAAYKNKFGSHDESTKNWYTGSPDPKLWNAGTDENPIKTSYDPCPENWRIPTKAELEGLEGGNLSPVTVTIRGEKGVYYNGSKNASTGLLLPVGAGQRKYYDGGMQYKNETGVYWSSYVDGNSTYYIRTLAGVGTYTYAGYGRSIRCVYDKPSPFEISMGKDTLE